MNLIWESLLIFFAPLKYFRLAKLLVDSDNIQRLFIDEFAANTDFVGDCIIQFFESIMAADNCENLRSKSVLNPTSDGDAMGQPARLMVNKIYSRL